MVATFSLAVHTTTLCRPGTNFAPIPDDLTKIHFPFLFYVSFASLSRRETNEGLEMRVGELRLALLVELDETRCWSAFDATLKRKSKF